MLPHAPESPENHWLGRPLAIVGMGCRLPGADGLDAFWDLLSNGGYAIERMPESKLNRALYFHPEKGQRGKTYTEIGGFVAQRELDWKLLGLTPDAASDWDECHLNFCEVAARACQHAGYDPLNLPYRNVGVYVGHSGGSTLGGELAYRTLSEDYVRLLDDLSSWPAVAQQLEQNGFTSHVAVELLKRIRAGRPERKNGKPYVDADFAAALVTRTLGLTGPHMSIDAACASSLVALALGASSLHAGETDMVIIGGASFNKSDSLILFSNAQSCSANATRPFDEAADGLIGSEGYVAMVLKTYARALADGDTIQAVIRGIGFSSDGRGRSLWAPRKEGQVEAIRRAYSNDVPPDSVHMIEAHATSTQVGDATEMEALSSFYQPYFGDGKRLAVGSVKSNIGHTLETAGLAGLVKSVLSIQHATIPSSVNIQHLSPSIPWSEIPLYVPRESETWPATLPGQPRRAAVNAFGIGGLNVHVVVDQFLPNAGLPFARTRKEDREPIAIVGRGIVLPGALHLAAFREFVYAPRQHKTLPTFERTSDRAAGFITDFAYDWRRHKVPPKQILQANPLQFMLLDAAEQALREAKLLDREFDRRGTAVVVGSAFGGDFGNALFAGLRLPEFRHHLESILLERGIAREQTTQILDEYETQFLKTFPALVDETGSFTSSTLASRLSKTFDLMGGAMAIDAGCTSGLAAVNAACQLLRGGTISQVLCAAAQRALDRAAMENLEQLGRIGKESIGEGVALVLLKRWSDAQRAGDRVFGLITDIAVGFDAHSLENSVNIAVQRLAPLYSKQPQLVGNLHLPAFDRAVEAGLIAPGLLQESRTLQSIGHMQAAQGTVDLIASTLDTQHQVASQVIAGHAPGGQCYLLATCSEESALKQPKQPSSTATAITPHQRSPSSNPVLAIHRYEAATRAELANLLTNPQVNATSTFSQVKNWRAGIVCQPDDLAAQAYVLAEQLGNEAAALPLAE
jgi:acyl transferase domain-containing protein